MYSALLSKAAVKMMPNVTHTHTHRANNSCNQFKKGVEGLPSWVPDWRKVNVLSEAWFQAYHDCRYYQPNGTKAANMQVLANPTCVTVRDGFVDSIVQQTEVFHGQSTDDVLMITEQMLEWWAVAERVFFGLWLLPDGRIRCSCFLADSDG